MREYLFVYGTLRRSSVGQDHPLLQKHADFIGPANTAGKLFEVAGYPGAIAYHAQSPFRIHGEVYRLYRPTKILSRLDEYEECTPRFPVPHEYRRCKKKFILNDGRSLLAWIYLYNRPIIGLTLISSGNYQRFLSRDHASSSINETK